MSRKCTISLVTLATLAIAAVPTVARADTLDPEECAVRIPLSAIKTAAEPAVENALDRLRELPHAEINWINFINSSIARDGNRIRFQTSLMVGFGPTLFAIVIVRVWIKWVESDVNRDWELCNHEPDPLNPSPYSSDLYPIYPDFVVDEIGCLPGGFDGTLGIITASFCGVVNHNEPTRRDAKCRIQHDLYDELNPLLRIRLFEANPGPTNNEQYRYRYQFRHLGS